jgi:hypothetical protein
MTESTISSFVAEQRELLALELQADEEQDSENDKEERASHLLGNLEASDVSVGLYGRTVVQLTLWSEKVSTSSKSGNILPAHRLTVGDEVEIRSKIKPQKGYPGGVVCEVSDTHMAVALMSKGKSAAKGGASSNDNGDNDDEDAIGSPPLTLVPRSSAEVHRKLLKGLSALEKQGANHPVAGTVIQAMFHPQTFPPPPASSSAWEPMNSQLDSSQKDAIAFGLQAGRPIALIHGPPGTGKVSKRLTASLVCATCFIVTHAAILFIHSILLQYATDNHGHRTHSTGRPCS